MSPRFVTRQTEFLGETVVEAVVAGGLAVMVVPKRSYRRSYALLGTRYGSIDSRFRSQDGGTVRVPDGIAHFLEHKMFEKEDGDVTDRFAAMGCSTNAMTSFNHTGYLIECTENFEPSLELLVDFVTRPYFDPGLVEKEKGIIAEEIRMYEDDPGWKGYMAVLGNLYRTHPVAIDIAGTVESISGITAEHLHLCHQAFYRPDNMLLAVAGGVSVPKVLEIANKVMAQNLRTDPSAAERLPPTDTSRVRRRRSRSRMPLSIGKLFLGFKTDPSGMDGVALAELEIALEIQLGAILSKGGWLHAELYRKGLLDDTFHYSVNVEQEYAFVILGGDSPSPATLEKALVTGLFRSVDKGLESADIERLRRRMYGSFVRSFDSVEAICWNIAECHGKDFSYSDYGGMIRGMTDRRIRKIVRAAIAPGRCASHILLPAE